MDDYIITERAGRFVAGYRNTGVGTALRLTPKQAEHELRLGTLRRAGSEVAPLPDASPEALPATEAETDAVGDNTILPSDPEYTKADGVIAADLASSPDSPTPQSETQKAHLEAMTVAQLRELAAAQGVELPAGARKADIVAALASFTSDTARGTA